MSTEPPAPAAGDELDRVARNLYAALGEARPYVRGRSLPEGHPERDWRAETADDVRGRSLPEGHPERDWRAETADDVLDRVDAALADAGELLATVTS